MKKSKGKKVWNQEKKRYEIKKRHFGPFSEAGDKYGKKYVIMVMAIFVFALIGAYASVVWLVGVILGLI